MRMKHNYINVINVRDENGKGKALEVKRMIIPKWLVRLIFGISCESMVVIPGKYVKGIVIREKEDKELACPERN